MYNLLKRLSRKHSITLVSFIRNEEERGYAKDLKFCESVHMVMRGRAWQPKYYIGTIFSSYPFLLYTYENSLMRTTIRDLLSSKAYDVVHLEPFYVMPSVPTNVTAPLVISEHNVEYDVYESYVRRFPISFLRPWLMWDVGKLRRWERMAWKRADVLTAVSREDSAIMERCRSKLVHVVPNGVDLSSFPYRAPVKKKHINIVFIGNFRWLPNRDAANELVENIWPHIQKRIPDARLIVVGRDMPVDLKRRVSQIGGKAMDSVTDIASVYRDADILVAPHAISGGTKFKMLEAMASGVSIVTSAEGMSGLGAIPETHYFPAQSPDEYVKQVCRVYEDTAAAKAMSQRARKFVETHYGWEHIADELDSVWKKAYDRT